MCPGLSQCLSILLPAFEVTFFVPDTSSPTSLFAQISCLLSQHCVVTGTLHVTVSGLALLPFWNHKTWSSRTTFQPTVKPNPSAGGAASLALLCRHAAGDTGRWNPSAAPSRETLPASNNPKLTLLEGFLKQDITPVHREVLESKLRNVSRLLETDYGENGDLHGGHI